MFQYTFKFELSAYFLPPNSDKAEVRKMAHTKGLELETYRNKDKIHFWIRKDVGTHKDLVDHGVITKAEMLRQINIAIDGACQLEVNDDIPVGYHTW